MELFSRVNYKIIFSYLSLVYENNYYNELYKFCNNMVLEEPKMISKPLLSCKIDCLEELAKTNSSFKQEYIKVRSKCFMLDL